MVREELTLKIIIKVYSHCAPPFGYISQHVIGHFKSKKAKRFSTAGSHNYQLNKRKCMQGRTLRLYLLCALSLRGIIYKP